MKQYVAPEMDRYHGGLTHPLGECGEGGMARRAHRQKVRDYLCSEIERLQPEAGARLPPGRRLAAHLGVSISTVQQVYRELAREGRLESRVGMGTFFRSAVVARAAQQIAISMDIPDGESGPSWGGAIVSGVLAEAGAGEGGPLPVLSLGGVIREGGARLHKAVAESDGLICLAGEEGRRLAALYEQAGKPVVFFNPPEFNTTGNFVAPDYFNFSAVLARAAVTEGVLTVALLMGPDAPSVKMRISGAAQVLGELMGRGGQLVVEFVPTYFERDGYLGVKRVFESIYPRPDLIYCGGDFLALGVLRYLKEINLSVPGEVMVVGGSGLHTRETMQARLSMMQQPLEAAGRAALWMLLRRIALGGADLPGEFLPATLLAGGTIRPEVYARFVALNEATLARDGAVRSCGG